jgi:hypothetical protein
MTKQANDPFRSTFSLLAGQGTAHRPHYALTHVEPLPDTMPAAAHQRRRKLVRRLALLAQAVALLHLR